MSTIARMPIRPVRRRPMPLAAAMVFGGALLAGGIWIRRGATLAEGMRLREARQASAGKASRAHAIGAP